MGEGPEHPVDSLIKITAIIVAVFAGFGMLIGCAGMLGLATI